MSELVIVFGPCGAGKTTWARANLPDHAHPDAEQLSRTLFATPDRFRLHPWTRAAGRRLGDTAVRYLLSAEIPACVTIRAATRMERARWLGIATEYKVPARLVHMATDRQVCMARAMRDPLRPRTSRGTWPQIINNWFKAF